MIWAIGGSKTILAGITIGEKKGKIDAQTAIVEVGFSTAAMPI